MSKQRDKTTALPKPQNNLANRQALAAARQSGYLDGVNAYAEAEEQYIFPAFNTEKLLERLHVDIVATLTAKHGFIEGELLDIMRDKLRALAAALNDADIVNRSWLAAFGTTGIDVSMFMETRDLLADALAHGITRIDAGALFQQISETFHHKQVRNRLAIIRASLKPGRTPDNVVTVITRRALQMKAADPALTWKSIGKQIIEEFSNAGAHPDALAVLEHEDAAGTLADYLRRTCNNRKR